VRAELFHADGQTDLLKRILAFRNFANASKNLIKMIQAKRDSWGNCVSRRFDCDFNGQSNSYTFCLCLQGKRRRLCVASEYVGVVVLSALKEKHDVGKCCFEDFGILRHDADKSSRCIE
jgi:hypothetical protein